MESETDGSGLLRRTRRRFSLLMVRLYIKEVRRVAVSPVKSAVLTEAAECRLQLL